MACPDRRARPDAETLNESRKGKEKVTIHAHHTKRHEQRASVVLVCVMRVDHLLPHFPYLSQTELVHLCLLVFAIFTRIAQ
jgi:hypothetical protein